MNLLRIFTTKATGKATDLATNQEVEAPSRWPITLDPYQLRSFGLAPAVDVNQK